MLAEDQPGNCARGKRLDFLDGIRALSITLVVYCHIAVATGRSLFPHSFDPGRLGVGAFFVVSGFIITRLLLMEFSSTGRVSLSGFYRRRIAKLLPPLLILVAAVMIANFVTGNSCRPIDIASALAFVKAFFIPRDATLGCAELVHTWSLTIEEIFYFVVSLLVASRLRNRLGVGMLLLLGASVLVRSLNYAVASPKYAASVGWYSYLPVVEHLAEPAIGALAAMVCHARSNFLSLRMAVTIQLLSLAGLLGTAFAEWAEVGAIVRVPFSHALNGLCVGGVVISLIQQPKCGVASALSAGVFKWIGKRSYGIYLWQQFFILFSTHNEPRVWFQEIPLALGLTILFADLSFRIIEEPCTAWARRARRDPTNLQYDSGADSSAA